MNVLFLPQGPIVVPSSRYRLYQYLPFLRQHNVEFRVMNQPGPKLGARIVFALKLIVHLIWADVLFVQKHVPGNRPLGVIRRLNRKIILDLDDAIWITNSGKFDRDSIPAANPLTENLTEFVKKDCTAIIVGNEFLASFVRQFHHNVYVLPTVIDTHVWKKSRSVDRQHITVGWIGTRDNVKFLRQLDGVFTYLHCRYGDRVSLKVICDTPLTLSSSIRLTNTQWSLESEALELGECNIGIMPLIDDEWTRGKCGFKIIQYMSMEIPVVASPVGVNRNIIEDGVNGFIAGTEGEWREKLSLLIENETLRQRLGIAGRKKVEQYYSLGGKIEEFVAILERVKNDRLE